MSEQLDVHRILTLYDKQIASLIRENILLKTQLEQIQEQQMLQKGESEHDSKSLAE